MRSRPSSNDFIIIIFQGMVRLSHHTYRLAPRPRAIISRLVVSNHVEQHALAVHQASLPSSWISSPVLPSEIPLACSSSPSVQLSVVVASIRVGHRRNPQVLLVQGPVSRSQGGHEQHRPELHGATMWSRRLSLHGAARLGHLGPVSRLKAATCAPSKHTNPSFSIPRGRRPQRQVHLSKLDTNTTTTESGIAVRNFANGQGNDQNVTIINFNCWHKDWWTQLCTRPLKCGPSVHCDVCSWCIYFSEFHK